MIKPYLMFNRECEEAFKLYQKAFDGEMVSIQKYGEMPPSPNFPVEESDKDLVLHAQLRLTETGFIMGSDVNRDINNGENVCISVEPNSEELAEKAWNVLKEGGEIQMELQQTFFAKLHGTMKDKYGVIWIFTVM